MLTGHEPLEADVPILALVEERAGSVSVFGDSDCLVKDRTNKGACGVGGASLMLSLLTLRLFL